MSIVNIDGLQFNFPDDWDVKLKLRQLLKPVDAHPFVAEMAKMGTLGWRVSNI